MRLLTTSLLVATFALTACGPGREVSDFVGQGSSNGTLSSKLPKAVANINPLMPKERAGFFKTLRAQRDAYLGTPLYQVTDLVIEPVPGGAIVRATAVAEVDDVYDIRLIPADDQLRPDEEGVLVFSFQGVHPARPSRTTTPRQRTFVVAQRMTVRELAEISIIQVQGQQNAQSIQRR